MHALVVSEVSREATGQIIELQQMVATLAATVFKLAVTMGALCSEVDLESIRGSPTKIGNQVVARRRPQIVLQFAGTIASSLTKQRSVPAQKN